MSTRQAALYARISKDDGTALGVARQLSDCAAEAERRGWAVAGEYVDNNVSATHARVRPAYERLLSDVEDGTVTAVVVWDVDRLTRKPAELEVFIELADRKGLALASVGGEIDLSTPQGRLTARIKGSVARHEAEQMGRRIKRKHEQNAREGRAYTGQTPFGYERAEVEVDGQRRRTLVPLEGEAREVREAYRRILEGESLWQIGRDWKDRGVQGKRGKTPVGSQIGHMLRRPVYAGLRTFRGETLGRGDWEPLVSEDDYARALAILDAPGRFHTRGTAPRYLLSGIAQCGKCGGKLRPKVFAAKNPAGRAPALTCPQCGGITRKMKPIDETVTAVVLARLEAMPLALEVPTGDAHREAIEARDAITARLDSAADAFAAGSITARQLARITGQLKGDLTGAEARVLATSPNPALARVEGPGAREAWEASPLQQRRDILRELCEVTVLPTGPGVPFEPEHVRIEWKA